MKHVLVEDLKRLIEIWEESADCVKGDGSSYIGATFYSCISGLKILIQAKAVETIEEPSKTAQGLTEAVMKFLSIHTSATIHQVRNLYLVIGLDWMKLTKACEMLDRGIEFNSVYRKAVLGEI